jgi:PPIC-type PPIASE domain
MSITISEQDIQQEIKLSLKIAEIAEQIVNRKIIENTVKELGILLENHELQKAADKLRLTYKLNTSAETWSWLEKHHLTLDDFEEIVYHSLLSSKLAYFLFADKVEQYFYDNKLNYLSVVMYEIVFNDEDVAWEIFYAIKEGEMTFANAAYEYIQEIELRRQGGYRGKLNRKDLKPEISAAVFAAQPPQLLKPIITSKGVHLVFVEEIIQVELDNKLRHQIMMDLFIEWLNQKRQELELVININPDS